MTGGRICFFVTHGLDLPPTQDASHHQDYETFFAGNLYKPSLVSVSGKGVDPTLGLDDNERVWP